MGDGDGDGVDPHHLRWDLYGSEARDGVDPQKVQHKYWSRDGVDISGIHVKKVLKNQSSQQKMELTNNRE